LIDRLLAFAIRQRVLVIILALVFVALGLLAANKVPIDAVPDVTNVQVQVITAAPALGPRDVETNVTVPIERSMAGLPGVDEIRSLSRPGISVVTIVFHDDVPIERARQYVFERLSDARASIPAAYGNPTLGPMSSGLGEIYHFEVRGEGKSLMELRTILDWQIAPRLKLVPGVTEVNTFGGEARTMEVELDPQRLAQARIGVTEVLLALERNHIAVGGAYMVDGRENVTIRGEGRVRTLSDLESVVVETRPDRAPLYLRDLGKVHFAPRVRYGAVSRDGRGEAVVGVVMMLRGASSREVAAAVRKDLAEIGKSLPPGVTIDAYYDRTELVRRTIHTVTTNLLEASALVVLVLLATLASLRAGSVVAVAIPLALLGVFIGMWSAGISGNLLSLGAIDFGLVVDGAIIIVENAQRHLSERRKALGRILSAEERRETVLAAALEVRSATAFGELIIALVYVPILALEGVEGRMFRPMAMAVLFALGAAFVLSLTLVPALASILLSRDTSDKESLLIRAAHRVYRPLLSKAIHWPKLIGIASIVAFVASLAVGARLGREFIPKLDEGTLVLPSVRLPSVSLEQSLVQAKQIETVLMKFPEVTSVVCRTGRAEIAVDPMGINMTDVYVLLKPRSEWKTASDREGLIAAYDKALSDQVPGVGFAYSQPIEMNTNDLLAGISSDVAIRVYGPDQGTLARVADQMVRVLRGIPGARDVRAEQVAGLDALTIEIDRAAIARHGLDVKTVLDAVAALGGIEVGTVVEPVARIAIQVRLSPDARKDRETIAALPIRTPAGAIIPLGQLAKIELGPGPSQVNREGLSRRITVQVNVRGRDIGTFVEAARAALEHEVKMPPGYYTQWAGDYERLQSATRRLMVVVPIAIALILVLLMATFGRARPALLIFLNVPISVSGGVLALAARGMPLSISAAVGFIALFGVAVLNGLVLVSAIERARASGVALDEAVTHGAEGRLRPVLTTALVASLGFLPMAIARGAGAEVQRPLATVVIGGLVTATLLTLFVLPSIYRFLARHDAVPAKPIEPVETAGGERLSESA